MPIHKGKYLHEMALRILLHSLESQANKYGRHIVRATHPDTAQPPNTPPPRTNTVVFALASLARSGADGVVRD